MKTQEWPRVMLVAAFLVAVVAALYIILLIYDPILRPVLDVAQPFVIAIALALLLDPFIDMLERKGLTRGHGVIVVGLAFLVAFLLVGFLLVPRIAGQASDLAKNYQDYVRNAESQVNRVLTSQAPLLKKMHLPTSASEWTSRFSVQLKEAGSRSVAFVASILTGILSKILWLVIIPMATLYLLKDIDRIKAKVLHFTPEKHQERLVRMTSGVGGVFSRYIRGMVIVAILFSATAMVWLTAAGLHMGLIIGAFAGLLYIVPYIGPLILATATALVALAQPFSFAQSGILAGLLLLQSYVLFDLLITPRIVGSSVGVHPVLTLFSLALGARLFGVVGMVIAVPVAASIQLAAGQWFPKVNDEVDPRVLKAERQEEESV